MAEYAAWTRVFRYADIVDVTMEAQAVLRGVRSGQVDNIVLRRRRGMAVVLRYFADEVADPFNAIQRRWSVWMDRAHPDWRVKPTFER